MLSVLLKGFGDSAPSGTRSAPAEGWPGTSATPCVALITIHIYIYMFVYVYMSLSLIYIYIYTYTYICH